MIKWIVNLCFAGAFLAYGLGTLGLFKFPDPYTRMHAVAISDTLGGMGLIGIGLLLLSPTWLLRLKLIRYSSLFG